MNGPRASRAWSTAWPSLHSAWLMARNVQRRWPVVRFAVPGVLVVLAALGRAPAVAGALAAAARAPWRVLTIASLLVMVAIERRRRRLDREAHRRWLGALPRDLSSLARAAVVPGAVAFVLALWLVLAAALGQWPVWIPADLLGLGAAGGLIGGALAAVLAAAAAWRRRSPAAGARARRRSRYSLSERPRAGWATGAALTPLGGWPLAEARFGDRPSLRARSLLLLLLAVPMNEPVGRILAGVFVWLLILHLINLLRALLQSAFPAAWWLAPTPVRAARFAAALSVRALAATALTCAALCVVTYATGALAPVHTVLQLGALWLVGVGGLGVTVSVAALCARSKAERAVFRWRG